MSGEVQPAFAVEVREEQGAPTPVVPALSACVSEIVHEAHERTIATAVSSGPPAWPQARSVAPPVSSSRTSGARPSERPASR